jgi:cysteine desulfurase
MVMAFDIAGVAISAGSACSSGKVKPSHVLESMGAGATRWRGHSHLRRMGNYPKRL